MNNARKQRIDTIVRAAGSKGLKSGLGVGLIGSTGLCCMGNSLNNQGVSAGSLLTLVALILLVAAPIGLHFLLKKLARDRELSTMTPENYESRVILIIESIKSGDFAAVSSTHSQAAQVFKARGEEKILWSGKATSSHESTELTGLNTAGISHSVTAKTSVGVSRSSATHGRVTHSGGTGVVIVTDHKILFVSDGSQDNVKSTWDDVLNWQPAGMFGLLLQTTGQAPRTFQLTEAGFSPEQDHRVMAAILDKAAE